jgi:small-conductance mechanosensitive channel
MTRSRLFAMLLPLLAGLAFTATALAQPSVKTSGDAEAKPALRSKVPAEKPPDAPFTAAERIAGIQKLLTADQQRRSELESRLEALEGQFEEASDEFRRLDAERTAAEGAAAAGPKGKAPQQEESPSPLQQQWVAARDRFDSIIRQRQVLQQQVDILAEKIEVEQAALDRATSAQTPSNGLPDRPPASDAPRSVASDPEKKSPADGKDAAPTLSLPGLPGSEEAKSAEPPPDTADTANEQAGVPLDDRVMEARKEVQQKQAERLDAEEELALQDRAIDVFERDLEVTRELRDIVAQELQTLDQSLPQLEAQLAERRAADAPESELEEQTEQRDAAQQRRLELARELEQQRARIAETERLLELFHTRRGDLVEKVEQAQAAVQSAQARLQFLQSPLAPHKLWRWVVERGPSILGIVAAMTLLWWVSHLVGRQIVNTVIRRSNWGQGSDREGRAETLRRVFQSTASTTIVVLGTLALLDQAGVNVTVLLGGAAVLGAAIAFGSQNLIKDYFAGFMVLVESQYSVGHVVRINGLTGVVEDITLRMTVLRDEEGVVHFIPHNQLTIVSNLTHGWSRAVLNIGVGYKEDVDRVMEVLLEIARGVRDDESFGPFVIGDPEMLGVDAFDDSAVVIKFLVKTRPLKQWLIKRELLRRIKIRFDRLQIEIPFPHRTVFLQTGEEPSASGAPRLLTELRRDGSP